MMKNQEVEVVPRLLNMRKLMAYVSIGENNARKLADKAGAVVRYGGLVLFDRLKIDAYIDRSGGEL